MSGKLMGQIYGVKLTPPKREVLLAMAENAKDDGSDCKPGVPYIAWKVDLSERQVQRIQKALVEDGVLVIVEKPVRKPIVYRIDISAAAAKEPYRTRDERKGDILSESHAAEGDNLSEFEGDRLSSDELRVTSHGKDVVAKGDIGTGKTTSTHLKDEPLKDIKQQQARPRIYTLYEQLTGKLIGNAILADSLKSDAAEFPPEWIDAAVEEAAVSGAKSWQFVRAVLDRWRLEGFKAPRFPSQAKAAPAKPIVPAAPPEPHKPHGFDMNAIVAQMERDGDNDPGWTPPLKVALSTGART